MALELTNIFCVFDPPSILQVDRGNEFSHAASKPRHALVDDNV